MNNMPTSHHQYDDSAAAAAAAAVEMTSGGDDDDGGGGGDDSLDDLVMMTTAAAAAPSPTVVVVGGKRKLDDLTQHHHHHDDMATTTTTNDPMLLGTTAAGTADDNEDEMLPPTLPPPTTNTTAILLPPPQVLHHHHIPPPPPPTTTTTPHLQIRPSPEGLPPEKPKSKRINWGKSPHKQRLTTILQDWFSKSGACIDPTTNQPIADYRVYAAKVGISRTTLFKYIHKDPSKRRVVREDEGSGMRGKKRLMSEVEVRAIVGELRVGKDESTPPSRNEAVDLIVKRFGLTRQAASRQLTRHVMPMFHNEGIYHLAGSTGVNVNAEDDDGNCGKLPASAAAGGVSQQVQAGSVTTIMEPHLTNDTTTTTTTNSIHQTKRSIVISGVTSGLGRALLGYFYNHGHVVAGCGRRSEDILALQGLFPNAKLSVVDVSNDRSVQLWADAICNNNGVGGVGVGVGGNDDNDVENTTTKERNNNNVQAVDLVIANAGISPETLYPTKATAWEVPRQDFDETIDVNVKGVANMIRHFVPQMVKNNNNHVGTQATFVAMSSGLGRSPNPHQVAYCASKWAVEGMVKSLAMSLPLDGNMCAVPLAPGVVQTGVGVGGGVDGKNEGSNSSSSSSSGNIDKWIEVAGPMILGLSRKDNGKSLSVKGFYSVRYRQTWSFQDGSGIPDRGVGHNNIY